MFLISIVCNMSIQYNGEQTWVNMNSIRVLMFGWDFPPKSSGGLGVACQGLTNALKKEEVSITFVLPLKQEINSDLTFIFALGEDFLFDPELLMGSYTTSGLSVCDSLDKELAMGGVHATVMAYRDSVVPIACSEIFDLIHAHDWLSYLAGVRAKELSGKPLVLHVHATSFDQAGGGFVDQRIYEIEKKAFSVADKILAVSGFTKKMVVEKFGVPEDKVEVVHNGIDQEYPLEVGSKKFFPGKKVVLFLGRITIQKGPDYFLQAAKRVLEYNKDVVFVMAGDGDMFGQIVQESEDLGIRDNFVFTGAVWGEERDFLYKRADLFVMPSVSEPFGLVPLEAIAYGDTPVLISKQSGVSEVLNHAMKVDFWDTEEMANKIIAALDSKPLSRELVKNAITEVKNINWERAAKKCKEIYHNIIK